MFQGKHLKQSRLDTFLWVFVRTSFGWMHLCVFGMRLVVGVSGWNIILKAHVLFWEGTQRDVALRKGC